MNSLSFWKQKIIQAFHDPPAKPYAWFPRTGGHAAIAKKLFALFTGQELRFYHRFPDWAAAGADRPVLNRPRGKGSSSLQMRWHKEPVITHPLAPGFRLDVRLPGEETPKAQAEIRESLSEEEEETVKELGDILKDWQNPEELKKAFFMLWRRYREELISRNEGPGSMAGDPLWEEMPADSRCPDHSIWDHLHITTALCFMTQKNLPEHQEPWLFRFSIGPAQRFIKESRTSRDLWTGSFILSDLAWHAMKPIVKHYGPDSIIYPDLRENPRADVWLYGQDPAYLLQGNNPLTYAAVLPNTFTAILPRGASGKDHLVPIEELAARAKENVNKRWHELEDIVYKWLEKIVGSGHWKNIWQRQHQNVLYTTWSAVAWKKPIPIDYKESLMGRALPAQRPNFRNPPKATPEEIEKDREKLAERRKRLMPWIPPDTWARYEWCRQVYGYTNINYLQNERGFDYAVTHHQLGVRHRLRKSTAPDPLELKEGGEKCTICGARQALVGKWKDENTRLDVSRKAAKKFWAHKELDPEETGAERLCAVCAMKRFLVEAGNDIEDRSLTGINPIWAGPATPYGDVVDSKNKVRLPFPSTATIAAQDFLISIAKDKKMEPDLEKIVKAFDKTGLSRTSFPNALPRLAECENKVSWAVKKFLQIDPQYALFPDAIQGKISTLDKKEPMRKSLDELFRAVKNMRKNAKTDHNEPGTHLAVICMDGDHMGRLLLGDKEKIGASFKDLIHPKIVKDILKRPDFTDCGWNDLINAKRFMGPSLHAFISRALANFSHHIVPWVVEHEFSGRLIYAGGDDVLCLAPASEALPLAARLQQLFSAAWIIDTDYTANPWCWRKKNRQDRVDQKKARKRFAIPKLPPNNLSIRLPIKNPDLLEPHPDPAMEKNRQADVAGRLFPMLGPFNSLSAGIVFGHFKTPMSTMLGLAEHLLNNLAKKKMGRRAVAMSHLSRNGVKSEFALHWSKPDEKVMANKRIDTIVEAFSRGKLPARLPYKLREIMPLVEAALETIRNDKTMDEEEKKDKNKQLIEGFFQSALDTLIVKPKVFEHALYIWEQGIAQHKNDPERSVEGLLLAKALSAFKGDKR
jgi:CRISPR-associated protein Cmr2